MPQKYEEHASPLVGAAKTLLDLVFEDLDEDRGGTTWMHGHLDTARICLVTDYLIASARGVQEAAVAGAYSLEQYHAARTSDDFALKQRVRAGEQSGLPTIAALAPWDLEQRTKGLRVRLHSEHVVLHIGQLLDRLAACIAITGGLSMELLPISWRTVQSRAKNGLPQSKGIRDPQGPPGRARQAALLATLSKNIDQDVDAFDWLWQYRSSVLHRSEMISWMMQAKVGRGDYKLISPFPRQPDWAFHEAIVEERDSIQGLLILRDPGDVLNGLWRLVQQSSIAILAELSSLWLERRDDPTLVIQPGSQWPTIGKRRRYQFDGYGEPLDLATASSVHISPEESRRIRAAKVFDADSDVWSSD